MPIVRVPYHLAPPQHPQQAHPFQPLAQPVFRAPAPNANNVAPLGRSPVGARFQAAPASNESQVNQVPLRNLPAGQGNVGREFSPQNHRVDPNGVELRMWQCANSMGHARQVANKWTFGLSERLMGLLGVPSFPKFDNPAGASIKG